MSNQVNESEVKEIVYSEVRQYFSEKSNYQDLAIVVILFTINN